MKYLDDRYITAHISMYIYALYMKRDIFFLHPKS